MPLNHPLSDRLRLELDLLASELGENPASETPRVAGPNATVPGADARRPPRLPAAGTDPVEFPAAGPKKVRRDSSVRHGREHLDMDDNASLPL